MSRIPSLLIQREWQMGIGERAAVLGLLAELRPSVAIELGTYRGGSLGTIAAYSGHVHSFDLTLQIDPDEFPNVTFHVGDSHELLSILLEQSVFEGNDIEFALVDGDHSPDGVRRDLVDLLGSDAIKNGMILLHDTGNEAVRRGIESVPFAHYGHVELVDLDFVPAGAPRGRLSDRWGGLGLIVLDGRREGRGAVPSPTAAIRDPWAMLREVRRQSRRRAGLALRSVGIHPSQLGAR